MRFEREGEKETAVLQILGIKRYRRWYLPFWAWFLGFLLSVPLLFPVFFWIDIFAVKGVSL